MADQADGLAGPPRQRGKIGIMDKYRVSRPDGGAHLAMEHCPGQKMKPDHRRRHGDQPDTRHGGQGAGGHRA